MSAPGRRWQATLILVAFVLAVAAAAGFGWWYARESPPHQGPIVLISADHLSADRLAAYGGGGAATPAIDALAAEGVVFDRAYAHSPQTLPSHASILSGQLPFEHGVRDDAGFAIKDEARTLPELLRNRGFNTGAAISTFLLRRDTGVAQGFSFFDAELPPAEAEGTPAIDRDPRQTIAAAEKWMRTQEGQRFLLFVQVDDAGADAAVARLVQDLKERDLYDDATIVLVGDHGAPDHAAALADASLHVPLIVKQPDSDGAGRRVADPVQHIDILPTILDLVRAPIPSGIRGRSLRPVLDDDGARVPEQPIYAESLAAYFRLGGYPAFAVTSGVQRFIRGAREELFDLQTGGASLPLDGPDASRLRALLDRLIGPGHDIDPPAPIAAADEDAFAALGYLPELHLTTPAPVALAPQVEARLVDMHRAAAQLVAEKKFAAAIDRLRGITRIHPDLAVVHYQLGSLLLRTARYVEAEAAFGEAARLQPGSVEIPIALARTALRARDLDAAAAQAESAVMLAAGRHPAALAAAHAMAARVALARMDAAAAARHAEAAQQADPSLAWPAFVRGRFLHEEGKYEEALQALREAETQATARQRPIEDLRASIADTLARLERYADAEVEYKEELRLFPRNLRAYARLAMLYRASNRDAHLEETIASLTAAMPTPEGYAAAARLWAVLGDEARAQALTADARAKFRGDPSLALLSER